jgi:hypothetical protein
MFKRILFVLLVALVVASTGRADIFITSTETVNQPVSPVNGSPTLLLQMRAAGTSLGGYNYGNDITSTSPTVGDLVNAVTVDHFTAYITGGTGFNRGTSNTANPQTVTIVAAFQERITNVVGAVGAQTISTQILSGQAGLYIASPLSLGHPTSYGATNAAGTTFNAPFALYSLAAVPSQGVLPSPAGEGDVFAPGQINQTAFNTNAQQLSQAVALFKETNNGGFLVIDKQPTPPGGVFAGNGQLALIVAQINSGTLFAPGFTAADKAALNTIFSNLDPAALNSPFGFANFGSGTATDFLPTQNASTGDAELTFGLNADPGNFFSGQVVVPEPATFAVWSLLLGSGGIGGVLRYVRSARRRKA